MEAKIRHLEMIQGIINRMAGNSFKLKEWTVILVSALFALSAKDTDGRYIVLAYFPTIIFWGLDGYYLAEEKLFRKVYENVRVKNEESIDFSMERQPLTFKKYKSAVFSKTILPFYGIIIVVLVLIMILNK